MALPHVSIRHSPPWVAPVVTVHHRSLPVAPQEGVRPSALAQTLLAETVAWPELMMTAVAPLHESFDGPVGETVSVNGPGVAVELAIATRTMYCWPAVSATFDSRLRFPAPQPWSPHAPAIWLLTDRLG